MHVTICDHPGLVEYNTLSTDALQRLAYCASSPSVLTIIGEGGNVRLAFMTAEAFVFLSFLLKGGLGSLIS
jgi:hypothetical protein